MLQAVELAISNVRPINNERCKISSIVYAA